VRSKNWWTKYLVIVDVNNRPCWRRSNTRESHIEEQPMIKPVETPKAENFLVGYAGTIKARNASDIPRHSSGYPDSAANTVNILARNIENNPGRGNARGRKLGTIHLDEDIESIETGGPHP
jgi:hypothetical protein